MASLLTKCAAALCVPIAFAARQAERPPALTIDFVAVQADGVPVDDLQPAELEIQINGQVRVVRSVRRVSAARLTAQASAGPSGGAPYGTNDDVIAGRTFALVIDQESFPPGREPLLRGAIDGLLTTFTPADRATIVALPFGGVLVPFTSDTARIRRAMDGFAGQGSRTETGSELACRTRRFLESLEAFLQAQPDRRSPLSVVLFTGGLAGPRRDAPMALGPGMCELVIDQFRHVGQRAGVARANFYVLQPADIGMTASIWKSTIGGVGDPGSDNPLEGIEQLAGVTGGARLPLDASGTGSLLRVARETSAFYVAELERDRGDTGVRARSISVRVARPGVIVRVRPTVTFPAPQPARTRLAVPELLASRDPFTDLPLRVSGVTMRETDERVRVGIVVEPVDPTAALISVGAVLVGGDGHIVGRWFGRDAAERPLLGAIAVAPGTYRLRVAAIDAAGRTGAAEETIEATLMQVGPLTLGSLVLGVSNPSGGTAPRLEFGSEPTAIGSFDIYGGTAGMKLVAALELARDAGGPPMLTVPLALTRTSESRVVATGAVPVGALRPGDYVVRGVIRLEDGTTGYTARILRKR